MKFEGKGSAMASKLALARLSEDLMTNPSARVEFIADPVSWVSKTYGVQPSDADQAFLSDYRELLDDGNCCKGCGCPGGAKIESESVAGRRS